MNKMPSIEELNKAIKTLKDECKRHDCCKDCPMFDYERYDFYVCKISNEEIEPSDWELIEVGEQDD